MQIPWEIDRTTSQVENNPSIRRTVMHAELIGQDALGVLLRTQAATLTGPWQYDSEGSHEGRLRIDLLTETSLRIRYCEGDRLPDNLTPMLVGLPDQAVEFTINELTEIGKGPILEIHTSKMKVRVELSHYKLIIFNEKEKLRLVSAECRKETTLIRSIPVFARMSTPTTRLLWRRSTCAQVSVFMALGNVLPILIR